MSGRLSRFHPDLQSIIASPSLTTDQLLKVAEDFIGAVHDNKHEEMGFPNSCYGVSKALLIAYSNIVAREESNILCNSCCPGITMNNRHVSLPLLIVLSYHRSLGFCDTDMTSHRGTRSASEGAKTPVLLALLKSDGCSGKFYEDQKESKW